MTDLIFNIYRFVFARKIFVRFNRFVCRCGFGGLGVLNFQNDEVSGENNFLNVLSSKISGGVVFDVGANVGRYSESVRKRMPDAKIFAFEPHPSNVSALRTRQLGEHFTVIQAAVGSVSGEITLFDYRDDDGSSHASVYQDVIEGFHNQPSVGHRVPMLSLDDFAECNGINMIDLLKIDTEGHEFHVLQGAQNLLKNRKIKIIQFEFNATNVSSRVYFRDFWQLLPDYQFYRLLPSSFLPISIYETLHCEIFAYQNVVALLRSEVEIK
jgi:FkbM family methyltransferase